MNKYNVMLFNATGAFFMGQGFDSELTWLQVYMNYCNQYDGTGITFKLTLREG